MLDLMAMSVDFFAALTKVRDKALLIGAHYGLPMQRSVLQPETIVQRVFAAWSVAIPASFAQTFLEEDGYWHAWDAHHSVSLSSMVLTKEHEPVTAEMIAHELPQLDGTPVDRLPPGLLGRAVEADTQQPAIASRVLSGMLVADGRLLLVTITSDDLEWARRTWLSIRCRSVHRPERHHRPSRLRNHGALTK